MRITAQAVTAVLVVSLALTGAPVTAAQITRVSNATDGGRPNDNSQSPCISADGRIVAFVSRASNLVADDNNGQRDVFVHDRQTGQTTRVSVASDGTQGDLGSTEPSISADGRYVAFDSEASTLVADDGNGVRDVFVHDRQTAQTTRVSLTSSGAQATGPSAWPSISADGRYVAFTSWASDLVDADTNDQADVFVHDRQTGQTRLVSLSSDGVQANNTSVRPSISADGMRIAFLSWADNLAPSDTNGIADVFVQNRNTGTTMRVNVSSTGAQATSYSGPPGISPCGRYVAFYSWADSLVPSDTNHTGDIFVHDRLTSATTRASVASGGGQADQDSDNPCLSEHGRYVAFDSWATNLAPNDTLDYSDIFIRDRWSGQTTRLTVNSAGEQGDYFSSDPAISWDGRYVAFVSEASNLVPGDAPPWADIFVCDRGAEPQSPQPELAWVGDTGYRHNGVNPETGGLGTSFLFRVKYIGPTPDDVNLYLFRNGMPHESNPFVMNPGAGEPATGRNYYLRKSLWRDGIWSYQFAARVGDQVASGEATELQTGPSIVGNPHLSWVGSGAWEGNGVDPQSATVGASFLFKVRYSGPAPDYVRLHLYHDGEPHAANPFAMNAGAGDPVAGQTFYLRKSLWRPGAWSYRFEAEASGQAAIGEPIRMQKGPSVTGMEQLVISQVVCTATHAGAEITFGLSTEAALTCEVLTIAGRKVRDVVVGRTMAGGRSTLIWDGRNASGLPVPAGVYLVRLTAAGTSGGQCCTMTAFALQR